MRDNLEDKGLGERRIPALSPHFFLSPPFPRPGLLGFFSRAAAASLLSQTSTGPPTTTLPAPQPQLSVCAPVPTLHLLHTLHLPCPRLPKASFGPNLVDCRQSLTTTIPIAIHFRNTRVLLSLSFTSRAPASDRLRDCIAYHCILCRFCCFCLSIPFRSTEQSRCRDTCHAFQRPSLLWVLLLSLSCPIRSSTRPFNQKVATPPSCLLLPARKRISKYLSISLHQRTPTSSWLNQFSVADTIRLVY